LNATIRHSLVYLAIAVLLTAGLAHCSETGPTTNAVASIELAALDEITSDGDFQGLVIVMASWCPPCRHELPILAKLYDKYKGTGPQIIALSIDADGPKAVQPLINKIGVSFPVYWAGSPAVQHYKISGIPLVMVYEKGKLIQKLIGGQSEKTLERTLKALQTRSRQGATP
jgi:thiol-disulfide isomerase/thioredoxin